MGVGHPVVPGRLRVGRGALRGPPQLPRGPDLVDRGGPVLGSARSGTSAVRGPDQPGPSADGHQQCTHRRRDDQPPRGRGLREDRWRCRPTVCASQDVPEPADPVQQVADRDHAHQQPGDHDSEPVLARVEELVEGAVDPGAEEERQVGQREGDPGQRVPPPDGPLVAPDRDPIDEHEQRRVDVLERQVVEVAAHDPEERARDQQEEHRRGAAQPRRARLVPGSAGEGGVDQQPEVDDAGQQACLLAQAFEVLAPAGGVGEAVQRARDDDQPPETDPGQYAEAHPPDRLPVDDVDGLGVGFSHRTLCRNRGAGRTHEEPFNRFAAVTPLEFGNLPVGPIGGLLSGVRLTVRGRARQYRPLRIVRAAATRGTRGGWKRRNLFGKKIA